MLLSEHSFFLGFAEAQTSGAERQLVPFRSIFFVCVSFPSFFFLGGGLVLKEYAMYKMWVSFQKISM